MTVYSIQNATELTSEIDMSSTSLMKHKSVITRRRLIITFILATILTVSVMTGFSKGGPVDNNVYSSDGERIIMWEELPESGSPEDYDLLTNLKYTAQRIYTTSYFRGETKGDVVANVGMGIKYTQNVHNMRVVKGDTIFSEAISSSSLKSVAEQKYYYGDTILFRPSTSIKGDTATFSETVGKLERDAYFAAYGVIPNELSKHCINADSILSVTDDNVAVKSSANAEPTGESGSGSESGDVHYAFEVPTNLVADANGIYRFTLELNPDESTKFYRNEVRTMASADQNPVFHSVKVSIEIDKDWNPISVTSVENYDIAIPVLGSMNCTSTLTEEFSEIGNESGEVPESEFFESHLDATADVSLGGKASASDYLAAAFASYLDGSKDLELAADVSVNDFDIKGLKLSVNIGTPLSVKAKIDPLAIEYSGDKVYITLNDIKGYISTDKFGALISDPAISSLISGLGTLPDFSNLFGADILSTVFKNCEMTTTDGVVCIRLPFSLAEGIDIDASLYINDGDKSLKSITGTIDAFGLKVAIDAKPESSTFPVVDASYTDLSPVIDFIPDALNFALGKTYGLSGKIDLYGETITVDKLYIDRTDKNDIQVDGLITAGGVEMSVKLTGGTIYVGIGDIKIKAALSEIGDLAKTVAELVGAELPDMSSLKLDISSVSIPDILSAVKGLSVDGNTLNASISAMGLPIDISLTRGDGTLKTLKASVDGTIDKTDVKLSAELSLSTPERVQVTADAQNYTAIADLMKYVAPVKDTVEKIMNAKTVTLDLSANIELGGNNLTANCDTLTLSLEKDNFALNGLIDLGNDVGAEITYVSNKLYLRIGNIVSGVIDPDHNIALSLDTVTDLKKLSDILSNHLPAYLSAEVKKLLAPEEGDESALNKFGLIINKLGALGNDPTPENIVNSLFGRLGTLYEHSAVYYILDMLGLHMNNGELAVTAQLLGLDITLTPELDESGKTLTGAIASVSKSITKNNVTTSKTIGTVNIGIADVSAVGTTISAPADPENFVPVMEFVEAIDSLINTFTTATGGDKTGNTAVATETTDNTQSQAAAEEAATADSTETQTSETAETTEKTYTFEAELASHIEKDTTTGETASSTEEPPAIVYQEKKTDEKGNVVRDENGKAIFADTITIKPLNDQSLLKGRITKSEKDGTQIELEAHALITVDSLKDKYGDIQIDLYVKDGEAILKYVETKEENPYGETVSIDFDSVVDILASVMNILGVDPDIVNDIFESRNKAIDDIDATVFKSMIITGFDSIQKTVQDLSNTVNNVKTAIGSLKEAWGIVTGCTSVDELGTKLDPLSAHFDEAINALKKIKLSDGGKQTDTGSLIKKIIGGVKLGVDKSVNGEKKLYADVDNSITVDKEFSAGTGKNARVSVIETTDREKNVIKGIGIENLDVKTAVINGGITFTAGDTVEINIPDGIKQTAGNQTYSDLSDIKHLLFDIMNTANLKEFEIGGNITDDKNTLKDKTEDIINVNLSVIGIDAISFKIQYDIKVKLFTKAELTSLNIPVKETDPEYMTVAYVELHYFDCGVIPDCTTRLYFFDNMLYVDGMKITVKKGWLGVPIGENETPIKCSYTVDQFTDMISKNTGKFLEEFLFYLIPIKRYYAVLDVQGIIIDNINKAGESNTPKTDNTIAKIFKGYEYNVDNDAKGTHSLKIGLKELAGSSALGDLNVSLTGANDVKISPTGTKEPDDNILDNYISSATVGTKIEVTGVKVTVDLNANLRKVIPYNKTVDGKEVNTIKTDWTDENERAFMNDILIKTIPDNTWQEIWKA